MIPVIKIDKNDPKLGFLASESEHNFLLDGHIWLSVDHYIYAKMFEDTLMYDTVAQAKSMVDVKVLCSPKKYTTTDSHSRPIKNLGYMCNGEYILPTIPYGVSMARHLYKATKAKFDYTAPLKHQLINTREAMILDPNDNNNSLGYILMKIRDLYTDDTIHNSKFDITTDFIYTFGDSHKKIIDKIITITKIIKKYEGTKKIHMTMFEDALHTCEFDDHILRNIKRWEVELTQNWSFVITKTPKFYNFFKDVESYISTHNITEVEDITDISTEFTLFLCVVLKWLHTPKIKKSYIDAILKKKNDTIMLRPVHRSYRKNIPRRVQKVNRIVEEIIIS